MIQAWQPLPNTSSEGKLYDVETSVRSMRASRTVIGRPQGYELDIYVDTESVRYKFYLSPEDGNEFTEDSVDDFGYGYVEVYINRSGKWPERPNFVYVAPTPWDYEELVASRTASGSVHREQIKGSIDSEQVEEFEWEFEN